MPEHCPECGAPVPEGGCCRDLFHALLLLEAEIPGVAGSILHFYAVATYGLQLSGRHELYGRSPRRPPFATRRLLDGSMTVAELRHRGRRVTNGPARAHAPA